MGRKKRKDSAAGKSDPAKSPAKAKAKGGKGKKKAASSRRRKPKSSQKQAVSWKTRLGRFLLIGCAAFVVVSVLGVLLFKVVNPPTTPLMWIRWAENGYAAEHPRFIKRWVPLQEISPRLAQAVLTSEDQKFFKHNGFDWAAVENAIRWNMKSDRKIGASTISMQTARNVFLWQNRDWIRKGLEAWFTVLIEAFWSKERILEVYFNIIEWGNGIFGCDAAAFEYFHHGATRLSPLESAWLAAILPNPRQWSQPEFQPETRKKQWVILTRMHQYRLPADYTPKI